MAPTCVPLSEIKPSRGKVISDKDLEILLDRSDLLGEETQHSAVLSWAVESVAAGQHRLSVTQQFLSTSELCDTHPSKCAAEQSCVLLQVRKR